MKIRMQTICGFVLLLHRGTRRTWAQNQGKTSPATGVHLTIEPLKNPITVGDNLLIKATITNTTNEILVLHFIPPLSTFAIHIRNAEGNVPKETDEGCRMHQSKSCSSGRQNGGSGSSQTGYVMPCKETSFNIDAGLEYLLNYPDSFKIDVTQDHFVAVTAPVGADVFALGNYPHRKLGSLLSNSVVVRVVQ